MKGVELMSVKRWQKEAFARRYRSDNFAPVVLTKPRIGNRSVSWYSFEKNLRNQWVQLIKLEKDYRKKVWLMHVFSVCSD